MLFGYLADLGLGMPGEYLQRRQINPICRYNQFQFSDSILALVDKSRGGSSVSRMAVQSTHLLRLWIRIQKYKNFRSRSLKYVVQRTFRRRKMVLLIRKDILAQAVSFQIAIQSG